MTLVECQTIHVALMTAGMSGFRAMAHSQVNACSCLRCINWQLLFLTETKGYTTFIKHHHLFCLRHLQICKDNNTTMCPKHDNRSCSLW